LGKEVVHFFSFQQALHVSVPVLDAFIGSQFDWFPSGAKKRPQRGCRLLSSIGTERKRMHESRKNVDG
jgi:hypothetical protein